jgi:hypothetical protein
VRVTPISFVPQSVRKRGVHGAPKVEDPGVN